MIIDEYFKNYWATQVEYLSESKLDLLSWDDFIKVASTMNIRTSGVKIENRILKKNNWQKVRGHASHGDGIRPDGKIVEIKSSIVTPIPGSTISFKGIRPWHEIDFHYFIIVHINDLGLGPVTEVLKLDREQINYEQNEMKTIRPYSGKKLDREGIKNVQLGAAFKKGDFERWVKNYSCKIEL